MTQRAMQPQPPQDVQKMVKQAEREQESRKLTLLIERVKRQIGERTEGPQLVSPKPPMAAISSSAVRRMPSRSTYFER